MNSKLDNSSSYTPTELVQFVDRKTADTAYEVDQLIREKAYTIYSIGRQIGELLCRIQDETLFVALGFNSFSEYAKTLPFSRTTAFRLKDNYRVFIQQLQMPAEDYDAIDSNKLEMLRGKVNSDNFDELIGRAKELSREDLRISLKEDESGKIWPHVWVCPCHNKFSWNAEADEVCPELLKRYAETRKLHKTK